MYDLHFRFLIADIEFFVSWYKRIFKNAWINANFSVQIIHDGCNHSCTFVYSWQKFSTLISKDHFRYLYK